MCLYRPACGKVCIVNNDHGRRHKCDFSASDRKYPFWINLVQNIKIGSLIWNFVPKRIGICSIQWWCSIFPFLTGNTSVAIGYARMRKTSEMRPIFLGVQMLPYKNEKSLDLQNYSRISKTMKNLYCIPNTIVIPKTSALATFWYYTSDGVKITLSTHGLGNI